MVSGVVHDLGRDRVCDQGDAEALLAANEPGSVGFATVGYGIGVWHLIHGRREQARALFERVVVTDVWAAFG